MPSFNRIEILGLIFKFLNMFPMVMTVKNV